MKYNFKQKAKEVGMTAAEVGVFGGTMLVSRKFLDARMWFKNKIAADPAFADQWYIKHQGAFKAVGGILGASFVKNPWAKIALMAIATEGFIQEVRVLTADDAGNNFFDTIGQSGDDDLNARLLAIAEEAENKTSGYTNEYPTATAGYTNEYPTATAGINLQESYPAGVAGIDEVIFEAA